MTDQTIAILLVEDNAGDARLVREMLAEGEVRCALTHVTTVAAAVAHLAAQPSATDVVLLDLTLPDETGLNTLRRILAVSQQAGVVVMTGMGDDDVGVSATQEGARDYLVKGQVDYRALRRAIRLAQARQRREGALESQSLTDELTGLHNRRGFLTLAEQQIRLARRQRTAVVLLYIDLDRFKKINDTYGHGEGDRVLRETADALRACLRESDIVARIGGDEFVALAVDASGRGETALRARLERDLDSLRERLGRPYALTFSVGTLACSPDSEMPIEERIRQADALMYDEKRRKAAPVR